MRPLSILLSVLLAFSVVAIGCEKKSEEPPTTPEPMTPPDKAEAPAKPEVPAAPATKLDPEVVKILDAAIEARGGGEKLEAASSIAAKYNGKVFGMTMVGEIFWKSGVLRLEVTGPSAKMTWVAGKDRCWQKSGPVVMPCTEEMTKFQKIVQTYNLAADLLPLKAGGFEVKAGQEKVGDKTFDLLTIKAADLDTPAKFLFDPETHLLSRKVIQVTHGGQTGESIEELEYTDACGIKMVSKYHGTFMGKPLSEEELSKFECKPLDDKIFEKPEQVADGTIVEKESGSATVACTRMKGPYTGTGKAIEGLMGFMGKQKLSPVGVPMMIYHKAPPKVKKPKKFLTEICFPVAAKAPKKPKKKGKFVIKAMKPRKVLAAYGVGPYETKSPELMKLLMTEAKKRKLKTAGPMCQISFMDPKETAAEELVSEMQIPIKGGKKKKK